MNCGCYDGDSTAYQPVCVSSDNLNFFSPCLAGCTQSSAGVFTNCSCIPNLALTSDVCPDNCSSDLIGFSLLLFVAIFFAFCASTPQGTVLLKIVDDNDKELSIAFTNFLTNVLAQIPTPLIFGLLVDRACILTESTCHSGNCLQYDKWKLQFSTYLWGLIPFILAFLSLATGYGILRRIPEEKANKNVVAHI